MLGGHFIIAKPDTVHHTTRTLKPLKVDVPNLVLYLNLALCLNGMQLDVTPRIDAKMTRVYKRLAYVLKIR